MEVHPPPIDDALSQLLHHGQQAGELQELRQPRRVDLIHEQPGQENDAAADESSQCGRELGARNGTSKQTDRQERGFEAEELDTVEDRDYTEAPGTELNTLDQRAFRRTWMQTIVDTRNVS